MKNLIITFISTFIFGIASAQTSDWKQIQAPLQSNIKILYQTQKGEVIAKVVPFIGLVKSVDGCRSWSFIDPILQTIPLTGTTENSSGIVLISEYNKIYKLNPATGTVTSISPKIIIDFKQLTTIGDDVIIGYRDNTFYIYEKDSLLKEMFMFSNKVLKLLDAGLVDKTYYISTFYDGKHYLNQIDTKGELIQIRLLDKVGKRYFYYKNSLIRDNQYSNDLGQSWSQFDLPFTEPDTIFKYNNMLAFGKGDKIYFKSDNTNNFSIISLPNETDLQNTFVGKYILTKNKDYKKNDPKILRSQNGSFESVEYDIATAYVDYFQAGYDEQIIASYDNNDTYFKIDSNASWILLPINARPYGNSYSFSEDKYITIIDNNSVIHSSFDQGMTWQAATVQPTFRFSSIFRNKSGVFVSDNDNLFFRRTNERTWNTKAIQNIGGNEVIEISNQAGIYKNYFFAEILTFSDTFNQLKNLRDIINFQYQTATHYEMNTFYNLSNRYPLNNDVQYELASSYNQGFTFDIIHNFPTSVNDIYGIESAPSGHLVIYRRYSILISADEGQTWQEIEVGLNKRDYIRSISFSPDHYMYISTAEKGILKYKYPLSKPNIAHISLNEDELKDCLTNNDTTPLRDIKISVEGLSTQLTDSKGKAVFYTHKAQNKLFVHNENNILDLCKDTLAVNFLTNSGQVLRDTFSATIQKECSQLDLKVVNNYPITLNSPSTYNVLIKNSGNMRSTETDVLITIDPYQTLYTANSMIIFKKVSDGIYSVELPELDPSEELLISVSTLLLPYTPADRTVCIDFALVDSGNQCIPYKNIVKCNAVNRLGKNKTIALKFFEDTNGNCIKDLSEKYTLGKFSIINNQRDMIIDYDSIKYIITGLDTNNISFGYNEKLYVFCQKNYPVTIHKDSLNYSLEIPIKTLDYCTDIQLYGALCSLRPCFERTISYGLHNFGNIDSGPVNISITLDPEIEVSKVWPKPIYISGSTYTFLINSVYTEVNKIIQFRMKLPCSAPIGQSYCFSAVVAEATSPSICQLNKDFTVDNCIISRGSYDPNDKTIFVSGVENKSTIEKDDQIEYRIRFQNTGTDTAYTVRIEDKLSEKFDITSVKLTDYSHACSWKIENCILIVTFNNIDLVDSFTNSLGSSGFVTFKIKLKESIKINDEIRNKASIFFDFNDPIITNEVIQSFGKVVSTVEQKSNIRKYGNVSFVPNPTTSNFRIVMNDNTSNGHVSVYNTSGQLMKTISEHKMTEEVNIRELPNGAYIIKIQTDGAVAFGKLIKM